MMAGRAGVLAFLCCLGAGQALAEDRFYQVVDPDGHVRTVKVPAAAGEPAQPADREKAPDAVKAPAAAAAPADAGDPGTAAYDGDVYTDSETLEKTGANPEKKRFFIINDSSGMHMQQNDDGGAVPAATESPQTAPVEPWTAVPDETREWAGASLFEHFPALGHCLSQRDRNRATGLKQGQRTPLLIDKRTRLFVHALGVVDVYQLAGEDTKTVAVASYAGADVKPEFARPYLAMAGRDGCLTRMLTGYFQRYRGATQARHEMMEGDVVMRSDENYLVVILPDGNDGMPPPPTYSLSPDGQISMKWQP